MAVTKIILILLFQIFAWQTSHAIQSELESFLLYQIETVEQFEKKPLQLLSDQIEIHFDLSSDVPSSKVIQSDQTAIEFIQQASEFIKISTGKQKNPFRYELPNSDKEIIIPLSTYDLHLVREFLKLNQEQQNQFINFKQKKLKTLAYFLNNQLKFSTKKINSIIVELNHELFLSHKLVASTNTIGTHKMVSIAVGSALPQRIRDFLVKKFSVMRKMQNHQLFNWIPEHGGFFYAVGFGMGIYKRTDPHTRKSRYVIDLYSDIERLKSTLTGVLEVSANLTYGLALEYRDHVGMKNENVMQIDHFLKIQEMENTYGGFLGVMRKGETHFGWNLLTAVSFPPILGNLFIYTNKSKRLHLIALSIPSTVVDRVIHLITSGIKVTRKLFAPIIYLSKVKDQQISGRKRNEPLLIYQLELDLDHYPSLRKAMCSNAFSIHSNSL